MWEPDFFHLHPYSTSYYVKADNLTLICLIFQTYQAYKLTIGVTSNKDNAHDNIVQGNEVHLKKRSLSYNDIFQGISWTLKKKNIRNTCVMSASPSGKGGGF